MYQPQQSQNCDEEQRFLFGSKKFRCYGSIDDLNSPSISAPKMTRLIVHKVQQTDTLQSLELRYNSSMFEIKRLNKLWSNQSLFCKSEVLIPIFEDASSSSAFSADFFSSPSTTQQLNRLEQQQEKGEQRENEESLDQLLKRIDMNTKRTKKAVKRLHQRTANQQGGGE